MGGELIQTVALAGRLTLRPGQMPSIIGIGPRPGLAERLLQDRPAQDAPQLLKRLYALCGEAHSITALLAVKTALGCDAKPEPELYQRLSYETACEHIRRIWLDWPQRLSNLAFHGVYQNHKLATCPALKLSPSNDKAVFTWLEQELLGTAPDRWLSHWREAPGDCLAAWVAGGNTWPALVMRECMSVAQTLGCTHEPLLPHASACELRGLANSLAQVADFASRPTWQGRVYETGVWTRLRLADQEALRNAWLRLGARVAELVLLLLARASVSLEEPELPYLQMGALELAPGEALAWSEMARGLLLHWVRLADTPKGPVIDCYRIVAPTEWNFHPHGVVAQALARMDSFDRTDVRCSVGILAETYDPCIPYTVEFSEFLGKSAST